MFLSVIIPVYNRQDVVTRSIGSAIACLGATELPFEVIVVDDASTDQSGEQVRRQFPSELDSGQVKLFTMTQNGGVSKARNLGASHAKGHWLMFLDSDDHLIAAARDGIISTLEKHDNCPVVFFRCIDEKGNFIGLPFPEEVMLPPADFAQKATYGEAMTVIRRDTVQKGSVVFDESLIGYEGLSLLRLITKHGPGVLSTVVARVYDCSGQDRLSTFKGIMKRADTLARGHRLLVSEFGQALSSRQALMFKIKAAIYQLMAFAYRLHLRGKALIS